MLSDHIVKQKAYQIFLIEDDYFNKLMLETTLDRIGIVTSATTGNEALKLIEEKHNSGEEFDIMIIDINLPDGWDGITLMNTIKQKWPLYKDIIFIAQTAYADEEDKRKIIDAGFNEYITKPIDHEQLINIVKLRLMS
jgi:CheY-like chemotaxis protein